MTSLGARLVSNKITSRQRCPTPAAASAKSEHTIQEGTAANDYSVIIREEWPCERFVSLEQKIGWDARKRSRAAYIIQAVFRRYSRNRRKKVSHLRSMGKDTRWALRLLRNELNSLRCRVIVSQRLIRKIVLKEIEPSQRRRVEIEWCESLLEQFSDKVAHELCFNFYHSLQSELRNLEQRPLVDTEVLGTGANQSSLFDSTAQDMIVMAEIELQELKLEESSVRRQLACEENECFAAMCKMKTAPPSHSFDKEEANTIDVLTLAWDSIRSYPKKSIIDEHAILKSKIEMLERGIHEYDVVEGCSVQTARNADDQSLLSIPSTVHCQNQCVVLSFPSRTELLDESLAILMNDCVSLEIVWYGSHPLGTFDRLSSFVTRVLSFNTTKKASKFTLTSQPEGGTTQHTQSYEKLLQALQGSGCVWTHLTFTRVSGVSGHIGSILTTFSPQLQHLHVPFCGLVDIDVHEITRYIKKHQNEDKSTCSLAFLDLSGIVCKVELFERLVRAVGLTRTILSCGDLSTFGPHFPQSIVERLGMFLSINRNQSELMSIQN
eukprot:PhF_6_TR41287/c0_g1_i1/m.62463